jgi:FlaA1/EpsC-like NDP-sugar epimerase
MVLDKKILLFGGSGSLGNEFINKHIEKNNIINFSRDEHKHWKMSLKFNSTNLKFIIGDIRNYNSVESAIKRTCPDIIIIMAALKHIDRIEYQVYESIQTNILGPMNILNAVENLNKDLNNLETVLMISSDKACEPTNAYGFCKALAETMIIEKAFYIKNIKFVNIRYGNVLNSSGSIIPYLHEQGNNINIKEFTLTHPSMTRFVMTLSQSVELIEHAIKYGKNGEIILPQLVSMKLIDLFEIFSKKYKKPIKIIGIRPGEKMLESLISETQSSRLSIDEYGYYHIHPSFTNFTTTLDMHNYNSKINPLSYEQLEMFLNDKGLL